MDKERVAVTEPDGAKENPVGRDITVGPASAPIDPANDDMSRTDSNGVVDHETAGGRSSDGSIETIEAEPTGPANDNAATTMPATSDTRDDRYRIGKRLCGDRPPRHEGEALNSYRIRCYGEGLRREGGRIPAREVRPDAPYMTYLAGLLDVPQTVLSQPIHRNALRALGDEFGYETVHRERSGSRVLICAELKLLRPTIPKGAFDKGVRSAFTKALDALTCSTPRGGEAEARPALEQLLTAGNGEPSLDPPVRNLARAYADHLDRHVADDGLPNDTRERLAVLLHRRGMKAAELARRIGTDAKRLGAIVHGRLRLTPADAGALACMEKVLKQPEGSLRRPHQHGKRGIGMKQAAALAGFSERERKYFALFLPPHFHELEDAEQTEALNNALVLVAAALTPEKAAQVILKSDAYALIKPSASTRPAKAPTPEDERRAATKTTPERLQREFNSIAYFYGGDEADADVINDRAPWSPATIEIRLGHLRSIMGFLCDESRGAQAVSLAELTVACLIEPAILRAYVSFCKKRAGDAYAAVGLRRLPVYTVEFLGMLEFVSVLLDPKNGWMPQKAALGGRLARIDATAAEAAQRDPDGVEGPMTSLVSSGAVARATSEGGWVALCAQRHAAYKKMITNQRKKVAESRDAHATIAAILKSERPFEAITMAIAGLRRELAALATDTIAYAEVMRDLVALHVEAQTGFRRRTMLALDWRDDNRGHLKRRPTADGDAPGGRSAYRLEVERSNFKESTGPYFIGDYTDDGHAIYVAYEAELEDVNGFYADLDAYLAIYRLMLLRGRIGDALLVGSRQANPRLTPGALDQLSRRIWNRHLIWNPLHGTGFKDISTTAGWHAWRHIIATAILKATGCYQLAADSIQDSIDMTRVNYTRYVAGDRRRDLRQARRAIYGLAAAARPPCG